MENKSTNTKIYNKVNQMNKQMNRKTVEETAGMKP